MDNEYKNLAKYLVENDIKIKQENNSLKEKDLERKTSFKESLKGVQEWPPKRVIIKKISNKEIQEMLIKPLENEFKPFIKE